MRLRWVAVAGMVATGLGGALAWLAADEARAHDAGGAPDASSPDAPGCAALADLDPAYTELDVDELEARVLDASPLPPSMAASHLSGIEGALEAYRPERRACMHKVMLVHTLVALEHQVRADGPLWFYGHPSDELKRHFLDGPLTTPLSGEERRDVVAFVEAKVIPALRSDGEADRERWRRMYYGGLLACHADEDLLHQLGGRRSDSGCLDVASIGEATRSLRETTGVIDPW